MPQQRSAMRHQGTEMSTGSVDYAAVPLDIELDPSERIKYHRESLERINNGLVAAVARANEIGWTSSEDQSKALESLIATSLIQSHETRLYHNRRFDYRSAITDLDDERLERARRGQATPADLLSLLQEYPKLGSIEIAKLSHPLDAPAAMPMEEDVLETIVAHGGIVQHGEDHFKSKTRVETIPAMTVLRKQQVGTVPGEGGEIAVVSRQAFLVRGDAEALEEMPFVNRMIKNSSRFDQLVAGIRGELPLGEGTEGKWLRTIATSYYTKYVDEA